MKTSATTGGMPGALPSMWRALKRAHEVEPFLLGVAFSLALLAALPDALLALWFRLLAIATITKALKITDARMALSGECSRIMLRVSSGPFTP